MHFSLNDRWTQPFIRFPPRESSCANGSMTSWWRHSNGPFDSNGPSSLKQAIQPWMARSESSLPLTVSNGPAPPDGPIGPIEGGPSQEVPLTMVSPRRGCSQLFSKRPCFNFCFPNVCPSKMVHLLCNIVAVFAVAFTSLHWVICEMVSRPLDNPGYWNGHFNVTISKHKPANGYRTSLDQFWDQVCFWVWPIGWRWWIRCMVEK